MTEAGLRPESPATSAVSSPYKGLSYYSEPDAPFFFGREHDTAIIADNLLASRLTLLYGPSGVGKTSLLRAGVARRLHELAAENLEASGSPGSVVVVFPADERIGAARRDSWRDDPLAGLASGIEKAVAAYGVDVEPVDRSLRLAELLEAWSERLDFDILLIFDQFEESFLYHGDKAGEGAFLDELPRALNRDGLQANVLISIREDAYAKLDRFKGLIPFLYDNYLRVDHLDRESARAAIVRPIEQWNRLIAAQGEAIEIEAELVEAVLDDVQTGNVAFGQSGRGTVDDGVAPRARIETPFLQLVLERLWAEERRAGSRVLRRATLARLGGSERIVRTHLDAAMDELSHADMDLAAHAFRQLVTPSGTKIAHLASDLAELEDISPEPLARVLEALAATRILRPIAPPPGRTEPRYEIFHDVLAPAILDWRARHEHAEQQARLAAELARQEEERKAAETRLEREHALTNRFRAVAGAAVVFAAVALGLAAWAVGSKREAANAKRDAEASAQVAQASSLVAKATAELQSDPAAALDSALQAASKAPDKAAGILRQAALASHLAADFKGDGKPLVDGSFAAGGRRLVTVGKSGAWTVWDVRTGRTQRVGGSTVGALGTAVSIDGSRLAVEGEDGLVTVWNTRTGRRVFRGNTTGPFALAPDGRFIAVTIQPSYHRPAVQVVHLTSSGSQYGGVLSPVDSSIPPVVAFSPDGAFVLEAADNGGGQIWDVDRQKLISSLHTPGAPRGVEPPTIVSVVWSGDSKLAATARSDGLVRVFNARSGQLIPHDRSGSGVSSMAFGPNGMLVLGHVQGEAEIWYPRSARTIALRGGHADAITSIAFSPNGSLIATSASDGTARIWSAATGVLQATLLGHTDGVRKVVFSPGGERIATVGDDGSTRIWRVPVVKPLVVLPAHLAAVGHAIFIREGRQVVTTSADTSVKVADTSGRRLSTIGKPIPVSQFLQHRADEVSGGRPNSILFLLEARADATEDGTRVAIGNQITGGVTLWNPETETGTLVRKVSSDYAELVRLGMGPHRRWGTISRRDTSVVVFDARTGRRVRVLGRGAAEWQVNWPVGASSADGTYLANGESSYGVGRHRLRIWNVIKGSSVIAPVRGASRVRVVVFDRHGERVAGGTWGGSVLVWSVKDGSLIQSIDTSVAVRALDFSPNGTVLAVGGDGNSVDLWDVRTGAKVGTLRGHTAAVNSVEFSPDGRLIATASDDGTVRLWNASDFTTWEIFRQGAAGHALDASFDPTGLRVAVAASDGSSGIYRCRVCGATKELITFATGELPLRR